MRRRAPAGRGLAQWGAAVCVALSAVVGAGPSSAVTAPAPYLPSPGVAETDHPLIYLNGCHVQAYEVVPKACAFGNPAATRTIALFGDSHSAQWFAAMQSVASTRNWRLLSITKTHCPADDLAVAQYLSTERYPECPTWRRRVFAAIARGEWGHIDVLVMTGWQWHIVFTKATGDPIVAPDRALAYELGTRRTFRFLTPYVSRILVVRDTPDMPVGKPAFNACMRAHRTDANVCGSVWRRTMSDDVWAAERRAGEGFATVSYVDFTQRLCPDRVCPTVQYGLRMYKDDNHLTQGFMRAVMAPRLRTVLDVVMARATAPPPPPPAAG